MYMDEMNAQWDNNSSNAEVIARWQDSIAELNDYACAVLDGYSHAVPKRYRSIDTINAEKVTVEWIARVYKNSYLVDTGVSLFELDGEREVELIEK